jgi:sugar phosphate isomerase/epimerase
VPLIEKYRPRVASLHLKDLKKGVPVKAGTAIAPAEDDVPLGTGQLDVPAVLRAMGKTPALYYVEDESTSPLTNIPPSDSYLESLKLGRNVGRGLSRAIQPAPLRTAPYVQNDLSL